MNTKTIIIKTIKRANPYSKFALSQEEYITTNGRALFFNYDSFVKYTWKCKYTIYTKLFSSDCFDN